MEFIEVKNNGITDDNVLDLFCGAGGLSSGFKHAGFNVTGIDYMEYAEKTYKLNNFGDFLRLDLSNSIVKGNFKIVVGGPPCRPWSSVNVRKRKELHESYTLVTQFFKTIEINQPDIFLLENVPPLSKDEVLLKHLKDLEKYGYSIKRNIIKYSDYGAPIGRRRLIIFGTKLGNAEEFFRRLEKYKTRNKTVKDAIWYLRHIPKDGIKDHRWPNLKTIDKYKEKYETNKYGWYILDWNKSAPSFGNIMKTYILHPDSRNGEIKRVLSVKEASLILGFSKKFIFPDDVGIGAKYQMIADSVSPVFSRIAASIIKEMIRQKKLIDFE